MQFELDVHTHTLASGHAYGTITEMAKAAAERGLKILGITEHAHYMPGTCDDLYFVNLRVVPREMHGVKLMLGAELNIMDENGTIDLPDWILNRLDLRIASIHGNLYKAGTVSQNTAAVIRAMKNPKIDIIGSTTIHLHDIIKVLQSISKNLSEITSFISFKNLLESNFTMKKRKGETDHESQLRAFIPNKQCRYPSLIRLNHYI